MSHIKGIRKPPRRAAGRPSALAVALDAVQAVRALDRLVKASWRAFCCWILGHRWDWCMVRGDAGEPGGDECLRCGATRPNYALPCRCTRFRGECGCEFEGFVGVE